MRGVPPALLGAFSVHGVLEHLECCGVSRPGLLLFDCFEQLGPVCRRERFRRLSVLLHTCQLVVQLLLDFLVDSERVLLWFPKNASAVSGIRSLECRRVDVGLRPRKKGGGGRAPGGWQKLEECPVARDYNRVST